MSDDYVNCPEDFDGFLNGEPRDTKVDEAKEAILTFFQSNKERVCYVRQLQVQFEKDNPIISHACGKYAEMIFKTALKIKGFEINGEHTNGFNRKTWVDTNHDLDFICSWKGKTWGVEVKNTYAYIPADEMRIKIEMCKFLGIKPLFILRWAPKSYIFEDIKSTGDGFGLLFEHKIFPPGHDKLVEEVKSIYPRTEIFYEPKGSDIKRFLKYAYKA